ncbi:MAG TPA: hypothetical protein VK498_04000 [Ferruginibacter sp.]|nr:hypothetical protein [Ferruginibacter sp.]
MKIWRGNEKTDDKIIALVNSTIYKGNPKNNEIDHCIDELKSGLTPTRNFIGIPFHYIKEIRLQEGKTYIEITFGQDSEEHLRINEYLLREEIFKYFKQTIPNTTFSVENYSKLKAGKKPLIAMSVLFVLFLWTLYYAVGYDGGYEYEIKNGHYGTLTGIILSIASFGVKKTSFVFITLFSIAFFAFIKKAKNPPTKNYLKINRSL